MKQLSDKQVFDLAGSEVVMDIETYPNYFLICFKYIGLDEGKVYFEGLDINYKKLEWMLANNTSFTFNGIDFDMVLIYYILHCYKTGKKVDEQDMYNIAQGLIDGSIYWRYWLRKQGIAWGDYRFDHVDLIEVAFGKSSLKTYAGRLNAPYMQDLPYHHNTVLSDEEKYNVLTYCWNDTDNTEILRENLAKGIKLREQMGKQYAVDLRSKSDAQIAEVVISRELEWKYGVTAKNPKIDPDYMFKYNVPENVSFQTQGMKDVLETIRNAEFRLSESDKVVMPSEIGSLKIQVHNNRKTIYQMGIGGLHSTEKDMYYEYDENYMIIDRDVASYYPRIILNLRLYPKQLTNKFLDIYNSIVDRRLKAKADGDKSTADTLKIVINGSFGKFGSCYSVLFGPDLMIATTVSGQLYLLMLIERLELAGFHVISANTDGVVTRLEKERYEEFNNIIFQWERDTKFDTEETQYHGYFARNVNNYITVKPDGSTKSKGCFGETGISKNPAGPIVYRAVAEYLSRGIDIRDTITSCTDITQFIYVRNVKGGALDSEDQYVGKVVRWYHAKGEFFPLRYATNRNKVPGSQGAKPIMRMTDYLPNDIDFDHYIREAQKILNAWFGKKEQLGFDFD